MGIDLKKWNDPAVWTPTSQMMWVGVKDTYGQGAFIGKYSPHTGIYNSMCGLYIIQQKWISDEGGEEWRTIPFQ